MFVADGLNIFDKAMNTAVLNVKTKACREKRLRLPFLSSFRMLYLKKLQGCLETMLSFHQQLIKKQAIKIPLEPKT